MGLYKLRGRLSQLGQCQFDNETIVYAYVEIIEPDGRRTLVKRVAVFTDVSSGLHEGLEGDFYFDKLFVFGRRAHCQLWGFATAQRQILDSVNLRNVVTRANLFWGILLTPALAIGSTHLVAGLGQLILFLTGATSRRRFLKNIEVESAIDRTVRPVSTSMQSANAMTLRTSVFPPDDMVRR